MMAAAARVRAIRAVAGITTLVMFAACDMRTDDGGATAVEQWALDAEPAVQIGVVDGDDSYLMHMVNGTARLPDGRIAVLNAGSHQLRFYDGAGRFLTAAGRQGAGPGEFRNPARLYRFGDTLAVYDAGLRRLSLHDLQGVHIGTREVRTGGGMFPLDEWLHGRSWVDGPPLGAGRAPVIRALALLPPPDTIDHYRYVRVTPFGHLWVRQPAADAAASHDWIVYDLDAQPVAHIATPADFEIQEFGSDYVVGRGRDALDVEYVQLYRMTAPGLNATPFAYATSPDNPPASLDAPPSTETSALPETAQDSLKAARVRNLRGALRMMNGHQEMHWSNNGRYATFLSQMPDYAAPEGVVVRIVRADNRGFVGVAIDREHGFMCGMAFGMHPPVGWNPGIALCEG